MAARTFRQGNVASLSQARRDGGDAAAAFAVPGEWYDRRRPHPHHATADDDERKRTIVIQSHLPFALFAVALWGASPLSLKAEEVPVRVGKPFPALVLPSMADGSPHSIEQLRGRKILLHQFASW